VPADLVVLENETLYYTKKNLRIARPWAALLVLMGAACIAYQTPTHPTYRALSLIPILLLLVVYLGYRLPELFRPKPILVLDAQGFADRTTWAGLGRVSWGEVAAVNVFKKGRFCGIEVTPMDPTAFGEGLLWYLRLSLSMNRWWGFPDYFVPCVALSESSEQVLERMEGFWRAAK
jgi:hypothetical protein